MKKLSFTIFSFITLLFTGTAYKPVVKPGEAEVISKLTCNFTTAGMVQVREISCPGYHYSIAGKSHLNDRVVLLVREGNRGSGGSYIMVKPLLLPFIVPPDKELVATNAPF